MHALLYGDGFVEGTLVATQHQHIPIEQLARNSLVMGYSTSNKCYAEKKVLLQRKHQVTRYLQVTLQGETINVTPNQRFYLPLERQWIRAAQLKPGHALLTASGSLVCINAITEIQQPATAYNLSISDFHTFFVSRHNILVHNIAVVIPIAISFGMGGAEVMWATMAQTAITGLILGIIYGKQSNSRDNKPDTIDILLSKAQDKRRQPPPFNGGGGGPLHSPQDPKKDNNNNKHPHGKYEDASYHHKNSKGRKNPAPKDGQTALDNSVAISSESTGRIGLSKGEIVVLRQTSSGLYHGYVSTWEKLEQPLRNILHKRGWANIQTGKINWPPWA